MMAILIAASGGIAVGLAVGGLFGWFNRPKLMHRQVKESQDITALSHYHSFKK